MSAVMPLVSVLVPIYNVEHYIERCAESLFRQTYGNLEYVFVNDCTPDSSIDVLKQVLSRFPNRTSQARILNHEKNRGLAVARNTALDNSNGEFVFHVDSDDYIEYNAIELLVNQQLKTASDIVSGMAVMQEVNREILLPNPHYQTKEEMVIDMMQLTINHSIWRRLIRKSLYIDHDVRAQEGVNCGEDCWTMTQLAYYAKSFDTIDDVIYHYDCTRENSYMADRAAIKKNKVKDDIATANLIIDFFKDKEQVYYDEANRVAVEYMGFILKKSAGISNFEIYDETRSSLRASDKNYWGLIGWDKAYNRLPAQNYYIYRLTLFLTTVYNKILSYKYR